MRQIPPKTDSAAGRIRPVLIGLLILLAGLLYHQWWWMIGLFVLIAVFVDAVFFYTTLD